MDVTGGYLWDLVHCCSIYFGFLGRCITPMTAASREVWYLYAEDVRVFILEVVKETLPFDGVPPGHIP